jgi:hypothetical protein
VPCGPCRADHLAVSIRTKRRRGTPGEIPMHGPCIGTSKNVRNKSGGQGNDIGFFVLYHRPPLVLHVVLPTRSKQ